MMERQMTQTVLIMGASGKIGTHSAHAFAKAGWTVRKYIRGTDMTAAAMGADVIVNGLNPPAYHNWSKLIPAITAQVIAAAQASGATVILPGNIYNYGNTPGELSEETPQRPQTRKGRIRVSMEAAYRAAGVHTIVLRAGNFIDPEGNGDIMSAFIQRDIGRGRITSGGDPGVMQTYAWVPDWARAAVMLAERRATLTRFEDIPFPGHAFTLLDLQAELARAMGRTVTINAFPWWFMRIAGPFWELARELVEMRYLWSMPHTLSAAKFNRLLPDFVPSDLQTVMRGGLSLVGLSKVNPDQTMRSGTLPAVTK
jgi:nucleoside-diphosphate-sugar epimerase